VKPQDITDAKICDVISRAIGVSPKVVLPSTNLRRGLGLDSVGLLSIAFILQEQIKIDAFDHARDFIEADTVSDIIGIVRRSLSKDE
jgi:acyl carrier protein